MSNIIYGRNPVMEWLSAGMPVKQLLISAELKGSTIQNILDMAAKQKISVKKTSKFQLAQIAGTENHQGIAIKTGPPQYATLETILAISEKRNEPPLIAILDGVQDPHNLGAIIRSADGAGIHGIIIPKDNAVELTPTAIKSSAGAAAHVPVAQVTNLNRVIKELKDQGFWVSGVDQDGDKDYDKADYSGPTVLVMGSEGKGMRRLVRENCDFILNIPMHGRVNSLNVSVASALVFFEARKHRSQSK